MSLVNNVTGSTDEYDANAYMIDINAVHLKSVRTQCLLTEGLTQSEIRFTENKLVKLFGKQAVERQLAILNHHKILPSPKLEKWLSIVGLSDSLVESISNKIGNNFDTLLNLNQEQLDELLVDANAEEKRKMNSAMSNLKLFIEKLRLNDPTANDLDLHWDSWDKNQLEDIVEEEDNQLQNLHLNNNLTNNLNANVDDENRTNSPSPLDESKRLIVNSQEQLDIETPNSSSKSSSREFKSKTSPSTPPFYKTNLVSHTNHKFKNNLDYNLNMPKSKSHEEQLTNKIDLKERNPELFENSSYRRKRLESEPCAGSTKLHNNYSSRSPPIASPDNNLKGAQSDSCFDDQSSTSLTNSYNNITAPRSPRTQGMLHAIKHRFVNRIRPKTVICNLCEKPMMFGFKCKEKKCKYRCHKECASKVPPSCGLPPELFTIFKETFQNNSNSRSPVSSTSFNQQTPQTPQAKLNKKNKFKTNMKKSSPDSSNASSRNSSAPPSPIQPNMMNTPAINTNYSCSSSSMMASKTFTFNENNVQNSNKLMVNDENDLNDNQQIVNKNLNILSSQDSQSSEYNDSQNDDKPWPRQNSLTMKEWSIPWDEIEKEKEIGTGRFGTVFKGSWHGPVAIKMFNMANSLDDKKTIEAFRSEVATFRKTRHENLVLFMGACMNPPHLAIVTSYCKGYSIFTHLYERNEKLNLSKIINISKQISQGMGYLHARGIIHKDLRSKNVFYDNSNTKVTIADFGFFSLTKLCFSNDKQKDRLKIPKGWLCYLAPELMKALRARNDQDQQDDLPFSFATDMFSFGTIWHELIFLHPPFEGFPAEVVIWQVGKGIKQSLVNLQASKEIKDILMLCWAYKPNERPEFSKLVDILTNLPKKRSLMRSPSHPTSLMTNKHLY